jgi:hypothetical protein
VSTDVSAASSWRIRALGSQTLFWDLYEIAFLNQTGCWADLGDDVLNQTLAGTIEGGWPISSGHYPFYVEVVEAAFDHDPRTFSMQVPDTHNQVPGVLTCIQTRYI